VKKRRKIKGGKKKTKGLSSIVATLLIILISIVAIAIVWAVMSKIITEQTELAKIKTEFFSENIEIKKFQIDNGLINLTLEKKGGSESSSQTKQIVETKQVINSDIISVVDLSPSMRVCIGSSQECCIDTLGGYWESIDYCGGVDLTLKDSCTSVCGGILDDKIDAAQTSNKELINFIFSESTGSRIGLVGYGQEIVDSASIDLTDNIIDLNNKIDSWDIVEYTCICCGINEAIEKLQEDSSNEKVKKILVMSDGEANIECAEQNTGDPAQDAIKAACDANQSLDNLVIYSIGMGDRVDEETLIEIANCRGGKYFSAMNISELIDVYTNIGEEIKTTYTALTNVNYLFVVFYNETDSYTHKIDKVPGALEIKTYQADLTGKLTGEIIKIEIYPVIITDSGKEIIGPASDIWEKK
jgi:hypothetical protein